MKFDSLILFKKIFLGTRINLFFMFFNLFRINICDSFVNLCLALNTKNLGHRFKIKSNSCKDLVKFLDKMNFFHNLSG